jgi:hypothetical protein
MASRKPHLGMDHRVKPGGDEENGMAWQSSGAKTRRENGDACCVAISQSLQCGKISF